MCRRRIPPLPFPLLSSLTLPPSEPAHTLPALLSDKIVSHSLSQVSNPWAAPSSTHQTQFVARLSIREAHEPFHLFDTRRCSGFIADYLFCFDCLCFHKRVTSFDRCFLRASRIITIIVALDGRLTHAVHTSQPKQRASNIHSEATPVLSSNLLCSHPQTKKRKRKGSSGWPTQKTIRKRKPSVDRQRRSTHHSTLAAPLLERDSTLLRLDPRQTVFSLITRLPTLSTSKARTVEQAPGLF